MTGNEMKQHYIGNLSVNEWFYNEEELQKLRSMTQYIFELNGILRVSTSHINKLDYEISYGTLTSVAIMDDGCRIYVMI